MGVDSDRRIVVRDDSSSKRDRERDREFKDRDKDKDREAKANKAVRVAEDKSRLKPPPLKATGSTARTVPKAPTGLSEEVLTQVGQAKFEAQEEKLKDVARHSMALLRDHSKLNPQQFSSKVLEIRKSLVKYEMQYIRVWDLQENVRRAEIENLAEVIERCKTEAQNEGRTIEHLRSVLEQERNRRKRYDGYEAIATEVNKKKTRLEYRAEIDRVANDIQSIKAADSELEEIIKIRNQNAQLLQQFVLEMKDEAQKHQTGALDLLAKMGKPNLTTVGGGAPIVEPVEVIS